jgi:hypothetical protein
MTLKHVTCTEDYVQQYSVNVNEYFAQNDPTKKALMIGGGLASDILTLFLLTIWTVQGRSWRLPLALVFVYQMKLFCAVSAFQSPVNIHYVQATFRIQYPDNYEWGYPGFYSLTVPYGM